ncbi:nephrin [Penaeus vannamei]|uniref:nephrin n=1 Tax=Penaeus vannamei TaxID=6689 RepID=UPI00387FB021
MTSPKVTSSSATCAELPQLPRKQTQHHTNDLISPLTSSIAELPSSVQIIDRQTGHPRNGILGPYYPGQNIMLTCISLNGSPLPNITWWKDNRVISNVWEVTGPAKVQSDLTIDNVTRDWHNQTLTCSATNTHLAVPVSVTVLIQMYLLPLSVVISTPGAAREGQQTRLTCTVHGSRPPPIITWTLRGITKRAELKEKNHGLVSVSELLVNVTRADDNTRVKCTAENPAVPGAVLSNFTTLTVHYPPSVTASLGRSLRPDLLKEGDDVYFTCSVAANPPASTITWYHEGTVQVQNVSQGVIVSGESLVLQKVRRDKAGKYKCGASNALATVTSAPVHLKIRCECSEPLMYGFEYPIEESVCNLYLTESILELATACYISLSGPLLSVYYIILN